jgi:hypothetical protein
VGVEVAAAVGDDEVVVEQMGERRGFEPAPRLNDVLRATLGTRPSFPTQAHRGYERTVRG